MTARQRFIATVLIAAALYGCGGGDDAPPPAVPPAFHSPMTVQLYRPNWDPLGVYDRWAITVEGASADQPYTVEALFNGVSQGSRTASQTELLTGINHSPQGRYAFIYPISGYAGGEYTVRVIVRAGGESMEASQVFTFPPCDPPGTPAASALRSCPPS